LIDNPYLMRGCSDRSNPFCDVKSNESTHRIALLALASAVIAGVLLAGCAGGGGGNPDSRLSLQQATEPLTDASPQLGEIRNQANQLLDGGKDAFDQRIVALKGTPIVVNDWASWCGPCRFEFPFLQSQASKHAKDIAFLGVDSDDSSGSAETFLGELPLPYPSYKDPDKSIRQELHGIGYPATVFYDKTGKVVYTHQGQYRTEADLAADIQRYAVMGG
jgi:cytochrome c biogenesis protein CcmG, thiol:disulfide interchange protein DsbE